jgi:superfamily II DNA/RNA helicase
LLEGASVECGVLHGGKGQDLREETLDSFRRGAFRVLVATDVAARGIHIDGVDCVMHFDPPEDHKAYLHRSGRTARAGATGVVVSLLLWNQIVEAGVVMRRLAMKKPVVEVFSNNPHLQNLAEWEPDMSESVL